MKHYEDLLAKGCFSREQLIEIVRTPSAANQVIYEYQKKGLIEKVKRDFYVVISLETKQPVLSRYQIGSNLFSDACITHHSAFEVFGYGSQVFYECFVATDKRFSDFEYDGVVYRRMERKPDIEVIHQGNIWVTSVEQTVVDSIRDFEKIAGLEEVMRCMMLLPGLNEEKVLECLARSKNGFLYQKCGYLFEELEEEFHFSSHFFGECEKYSSDAKRYLMKESKDNVFHKRWKLYAPQSMKELINKGFGDYDAIG
ncbi:MAG: transcriptional regulator [Lachnospiraceae bacterium]|nr:transcriptional regulator [Lachnospiraceae bacterium]